MKAITLWAPWGSLIAAGFKTTETRTHDRFRCLVGERIAIHQGLRTDDVGRILEFLNWDHVAAADWLSHEPSLPRGAVVCTARVVRFGVLTEDDEFSACCPIEDNRFGIDLVDVEVIDPPVKVAGHQGVWNWEAP